MSLRESVKGLRGERNFSARERKALPFIIYEPAITLNHTAEILRLMDFRNVMSVYLLNYDDSNKTESLRRKLNLVREIDSVSLKKIFAARDKLFSENCTANTAIFFDLRLSVEASLKACGLSNFYKTSNFIQAALKNFFRADRNISVKLKILQELDSEFDTYKNVSQKSKDIFIQWLSEEDLETFFELIRPTAVNRMWRYREKFWRAYLPYITKTKIFPGAMPKILPPE